MGRVKKRKEYHAGMLWGTLKRNPGSTAVELAELMQTPTRRITERLRDLRLSGYAKRGELRQKFTQWFAVGNQRPVNMAGSSPNSLAALRPMRQRWREKLPLAFKAAGRDPSLIGKGKPRHVTKFPDCTLADCWTMPRSPTQAGD